MPTKICTKCHKRLPATTQYFYKHKGCRFGVSNSCKQCRIQQTNAWQSKHPDKVKYYKIKNQKTNGAAYRKANHDRVKQWRKNYYLSHKDEILIKQKIYKHKNAGNIELKKLKNKILRKYNLIELDKTKKCNNCNQIFPYTAEYFSVTKYTKSGLTQPCKKCKNIKTMQWFQHKYQTDENFRIKLSKQRKKHYREIHACKRLTSQALSQKNHLKKCRTCKQYLPATKEYFSPRKDSFDKLAYVCKLCKNQKNRDVSKTKYGKEVNRLKASRYMARKKNLPNNFSVNDWKYCLDYFNNACAFCGETKNLHADHFIPLDSNYCLGTIPQNIIPLCQKCNLSKSNSHPIIYLKTNFNNWQNIFCNINNYINLVVLERPHI